MTVSECISQSVKVHPAHRTQQLWDSVGLIPRLRPDELAWRNSLERSEVIVGRVLVYRIAPPI